MRKIYSILILLFVSAIASAQGFKVNSLVVDIYLNKGGYFDVVENYEIEFQEPKHGIFRNIITKYDFKDEKGEVSKREIYISNIEVPGEKFEINTIFGKQFNDDVNIRIGEKNILVNGSKHYGIRYRVKNALIFTDDSVQLYWNIKPSDWSTIFNKVRFTVHTPDGALLSSVNCFVYSGNTGNTEPSAEFDYNYSDNKFSGTSKEDFRSFPGQNVTVLVKLPKALVQEVDFTPLFWKRYGLLGILGLIFLAIFVFIKVRLHANKVIAVTSYYPPIDIDPAMAGYLIDNSPDSRDITCLLPYWATKGIIRMEEITKGERSLNGDLKFIKLKDLPADASGYEYNFFNKIFIGNDAVLASSFRGNFIEPMGLLAEKAEQYYTQKKSTLNKLKVAILILSELWAFFSITFLPFMLQSYIDIESSKFIAFIIINFIFFFAVFPFGFAVVVNMVRTKNERGKSIMPELLGFYKFIKVAEVERIKELLKEDPYYFEKTMPYAVAFNFLKEWTAKFEDLIVQAPDWYSSNTGTQFRFHVFAKSFEGSMATAKASMVTSTSSGSSSSHSSGGGSSGGGFGGGGGGSW